MAIEKIIGYHYTNLSAYKSMQTKVDGFAGLIPRKAFAPYLGLNLPDEASKNVIEGLLEPEPKSWIKNPEFPGLWRHLINAICIESVVLLSFELKKKDEAYVVDRAHVERELYKVAKGQQAPTKDTMEQAFRKYWDSIVPVFEYRGSYSVPQLSIWSGIEFRRLKVEWVKPTKKVWKRVVRNNW